MTYWSISDFEAGLCGIREVGTRRPEVNLPEVESPANEDALEVLEQPFTEILASHSREVYFELGGKDYLRRNPALLNKVLLKQVAAADQRITLESHSATMRSVIEEMPWVSARRLMYQVQAQLAPDIEATRREPVSDAIPKPAADPLKTAAASPADLGPTLPPTPSENAAAAPADIRKDYGPRGTARGK